uniref:C2H2-type domain-containing protein n=1 Tax=Caenorhabditis tropicalis TaxID=1561998 RepID=A0A1I7U8P3_9PELO
MSQRRKNSVSSLCEHKAIYHCPQNQRVWKCVYCNTIFGRRGGLRRHVQMVHMQMMHKCPIENCTHPGYKCTKALNAHVRTHTRPFQCDRCDASYTRKADLQNHLTLHN